MKITQSDLDGLQKRFWEKVNKGKANECWLWTGAKSVGGYGVMHKKKQGEKKEIKAHRVALSINLGRYPKANELACHHCDIPLCVNPRHIYAGTDKTNSADCVKRGRHKTLFVYGRRGDDRKLSNDHAEKLLALYYGRCGQGRVLIFSRHPRIFTLDRLARKFNIHINTARQWAFNPNHKHVRRASIVAQVRNLWFSRRGIGSIAKKRKGTGHWDANTLSARFGLTMSSIGKIIRGERYRELSNAARQRVYDDLESFVKSPTKA